VGIQHRVTVTYTYTDRFGVEHTVTTKVWQLDPAKVAILQCRLRDVTEHREGSE
jgi:hypothetical protein